MEYSSHPRRAFTFVELLVAIAIIAVLASLILGVGLAMRRYAKSETMRTTLSHTRDAFVLYRSAMGYAVDEQEAAGWMVSEGGGSLRPLTTMEYFMFRMRMADTANKPLQLINPDLRVPSTAKSGAYYAKVEIFKPKTDANGNPVDGSGNPLPAGSTAYVYDMTSPVHTLYDPTPGAPGVPAGTAFSASNTAPLYTLVGPWDPQSWDPADWSHASTGATGAVFKWRPHELDFRRSTAIVDDPATPAVNELETKVPPYLPLTEGVLFASPGSDGLWGTLTSHDPDRPDNQAKDNHYSTQTEN